jgi:hypothetical protein
VLAAHLDGDGSGEIVRANKIGQPYIVNNPSGGDGVYALPLPFTGR